MSQATASGTGAVFDIPVRWGDLDAMNHVNNTVYFRYIEEARVQLMLQLDLLPPSPRTGVLAHASLDFVRPVLYPGPPYASCISSCAWGAAASRSRSAYGTRASLTSSMRAAATCWCPSMRKVVLNRGAKRRFLASGRSSEPDFCFP